MKGSIQKKGNVYYAVIAIDYKRKWFKGGQGQKEAEKILAEKLIEIQNGAFNQIPRKKFKEFAKSWLKDYAEVTLRGPRSPRC